MQITEKITKLIVDLEPCIGGNCYNSSSYNGWTREFGKHFKYPVTYPTIEGTFRKSRYPDADLDLRRVEKMHYLTGKNEIYVGAGLLEVLEILENRFDLDFNKLLEEETQ